MIEMKIAQDELLNQAYALRREVFCTEQGYSEQQEFSPRDKDAVQLVMIISGEIVAAAKLTQDGSDNFTIGSICVKSSSRGQGLGRAIMLYAIDQCRRNNAQSISVMSELHAVGFYESLGFGKNGEVYSDGHLDRQPMLFDMDHSFGCCHK